MIDPNTAGFVAPVPNIDTAEWWQGLNDGRLTVPECQECRERFFPPQPFCCHCGSSRWSLVGTSGHGTVYSWVVANRSFAPEFDADVPYGIVAVDLEGGGRMIGRFAGDSGRLRSGLEVSSMIQPHEGFGLLWFSESAAAKPG